MQAMKYYSVLKRNKLSSYAKTWRNLKCALVSEKIICKGYRWYDSNYMTFWKKQKYVNNKMVSSWVGEEMNRQSMEEF